MIYLNEDLQQYWNKIFVSRYLLKKYCFWTDVWIWLMFQADIWWYTNCTSIALVTLGYSYSQPCSSEFVLLYVLRVTVFSLIAYLLYFVYLYGTAADHLHTGSAHKIIFQYSDSSPLDCWCNDLHNFWMWKITLCTKLLIIFVYFTVSMNSGEHSWICFLWVDRTQITSLPH